MKSRERGFTLIELLVVLSIISLLASVIIGSVQAGRDKANNQKANTLATQYVDYIELIKGTQKGYPWDATMPCIGLGNCPAACIGLPNNCGDLILYPTSNTINNQLTQAGIGSFIEPGYKVDLLGTLRGNFIYSCGQPVGGPPPDWSQCRAGSFRWYLKGDAKCQNRSRAGTSTFYDTNVNVTYCQYNFTAF